MSPALLSQRLKDLEGAGIVTRQLSADPGVFEYRLTESGRELGPIVEAFGIWGQRRIEAELSLQHLDVQLLMWDMRRNLNTTPMPDRRSVIEFAYPELPATQRRWWLIVDPESTVDLCSIDPGFRSADDDGDLDGAGQRAYGGRKPTNDLDRKRPARKRDA